MKEVFEEGKFLEIIQNAEFYKCPREFEDELTSTVQNWDFLKSLFPFLAECKVKPPRELRNILGT
jgi:hypothetical protein